MSPRRHTVLDLPDLIVVPGVVRVRRELRGEVVHNIAVIDDPGESTRDAAQAISRARAALADVPEVIDRIELNLGASASSSVIAAAEKRARRQARG